MTEWVSVCSYITYIGQILTDLGLCSCCPPNLLESTKCNFYMMMFLYFTMRYFNAFLNSNVNYRGLFFFFLLNFVVNIFQSSIWTSTTIHNCWTIGAAAHLCDTSWCPDMVVLQHHHPTQVLSVHGHTTNQHGILLHQAEARCCLACAGYFSVPASHCCHRLELRAASCDPRGPSQAVESRPFAKEEAPCWASHYSSQCDGIWTCGGESRTLQDW